MKPKKIYKNDLTAIDRVYEKSGESTTISLCVTNAEKKSLCVYATETNQNLSDALRELIEVGIKNKLVKKTSNKMCADKELDFGQENK